MLPAFGRLVVHYDGDFSSFDVGGEAVEIFRLDVHLAKDALESSAASGLGLCWAALRPVAATQTIANVAIATLRDSRNPQIPPNRKFSNECCAIIAQ